MSEVTIVLTSCNRPDLLRRTIESFLLHNSYPIKDWIVVDDGGSPGSISGLVSDHPEFKWILHENRMGQIRSIDEAYSLVKTKYVFHLEDDWETYRDGAVEESVRILEARENVSAVMCREHTPRVYYMSEEPPFLNCWGGWGHYSFNPGLRRMCDYRDFFGSSFYDFGGRASGLEVERKINDFYRERGYRMALAPDPRGYLRHIGEGRHAPEPKRVGLCMIVKDEAHVVGECLSSTLPLVDTYCVVDTGSSDDTVSVIRNFYDSKGIRGEIHERPWIDFGSNRSEALALCEGKMDYILVMDADDLLSLGPDDKSNIMDILGGNPSAVSLEIRQGSMSYRRPHIFKAGDGWRYVGVLHEYPTNDKRNVIAQGPKDTYITSRRLGSRNRRSDKMKRDIEALLKGLEREPDNDRYVFYLAQSYRDDGQKEKAVEWYTKRYQMGRWKEEAYFSAYQVSKLTNSKEWAWMAHECDPRRVESLVGYISHCRANNKFSRELLSMAIYAASIPKPSDIVLFLENDAYDWRALDELSIVAYYCGRKDICRECVKRLMSEKKAPADQMERIRKNGDFCS